MIDALFTVPVNNASVLSKWTRLIERAFLIIIELVY